ncbi:polyprenyl diphosphate synthase [Anaplasma capra]|uniref:polyprenyl diphosphate synthase n=1 Tax=Anaplasma capra TaxID=1562740 RepID=UPI0021D58D94|nr:polyprenyl diphosphate synthase [Anaplasma capra]MCU7611740.1 polyprenyl diphosphate synthase [Anaplasma capra]MCU7612509.1 polyprenyl diphosphate synthase [Anaplasma capra]
MVRRLPEHVAIIMDGNGRWAKNLGLPKVEAYAKGMLVAKDIAIACIDRAIKHLTLYAFSLENWFRSAEEVNSIMSLFSQYLSSQELHRLAGDHGVSIRFVGDLKLLREDLVELMLDVQSGTRKNNALFLNVAISYGARQDIIHAVNAALSAKVDSIDAETLGKFLWTKDLPDVDLLIRSGGEKRVSNFLLWQLAYAELYFCDTMWPDFTAAHFSDALDSYLARDRKYGR